MGVGSLTLPTPLSPSSSNFKVGGDGAGGEEDDMEHRGGESE